MDKLKDLGEVEHEHGDRRPGEEAARQLWGIVDAHTPHVVERRLPVEHRVGEGHASASHGGARRLVEHDSPSCQEEAMRDGGPDVARPPHDHPQRRLPLQGPNSGQGGA
jgi:hypothetical protein